MSKKSPKIALLIESFQGGTRDAHYLGYFDCFNRAEFYEAHDVLEELWLAARQTPDNLFYKGLIQLAGAFVHLQKDRLRPAVALFKLAECNLKPYATQHEGLDVSAVLGLIALWRTRVESGDFKTNPLREGSSPHLPLLAFPDPPAP